MGEGEEKTRSPRAEEIENFVLKGILIHDHDPSWINVQPKRKKQPLTLTVTPVHEPNCADRKQKAENSSN
jgi:hypothetical protein